MNRTFIIGDIHGCLDMLRRLIDKIPWDPLNDTLVFLGDYIDRGKNPKGVVDYILELEKYSPNIKCLLGNHEAMFLDYLSGKDLFAYLVNFGKTTIEDYMMHDKDLELMIPDEHMSFFHSLELYVELDDFYAVHAGFRPYVPMCDQSEKDMLWIREPFISSDYDFGKRVVFGHTPLDQPLIMDNKIGIDTGAVYGRNLTCLETSDMSFYSVGF